MTDATDTEVRPALMDPFLPAEAPLWRGEFVAERNRGGWSAEIIWRRDKGFSVALRDGGMAYVVRGIQDKEAAMEIAATAPRPTMRNTHTDLEAIHREDGGWIVRIAHGEAVGESIGGRGTFMGSDERPSMLDYHHLKTFGGEKPFTLYATDLSFTALTYSEAFEMPYGRSEKAGEIRSLWVRDSSDAMTNDQYDYRFIARAAANEGVLDDEEMEGDEDEMVQNLHGDMLPVKRPAKVTSRIDLTPDAYRNFLYVTQPDPEKRARIRDGLLREAVDHARLHFLVSFETTALKDTTVADFIATMGEWRIDKDSPYAAGAPRKVWGRGPPSVNLYGWGDREAGEDFAVYREGYQDAEGVYCSRHHADLGDSGKVALSNHRAAAALIYAKAKAAGDPRVPGQHLPVTSEASFKASGRYWGRQFVSFKLDGFADEPDFMIRRTKDGYACDFDDMQAESTLEACVDALYARLASLGVMAPPADLDDRPLPMP